MARKRSRKDLISLAVAAVGDGRFSVEELVKAALLRPKNLQRWIERHAAKRETEKRQVRIYAGESLSNGQQAAFLRAARRRFDLPNVKAVSWGLRYRSARSLGERVIVVWVGEKKTLDQVPPSEIIRGPLRLKSSGKVREIPVDVRQVPRGSKQTGQSLSPGKRVLLGMLMPTVEGAKG